MGKPEAEDFKTSSETAPEDWGGKLSPSDNPRRDNRFMLHREHFLRHVDPNISRGLEIGAFDLPMVLPQEGHCIFADFRTKDELIQLASRLEGHNPGFVQDVDIDLREGYDKIEGRFDWIVASHVIEHVPDVIGWLQILASKLNDNGTLFLIIPDKNFTFDIHRGETRITDVVDAHRQGLEKPSFAQVFDHFFYAANLSSEVIWRGEAVPAPERNYAAAVQAAARTNREYVDVHCSVFSPQSFFMLFSQLEKLNLIPFHVGEIRPTQPYFSDFSAVLRKRSDAPNG